MTPNEWILLYLGLLILFTLLGAYQDKRFDPFSTQMLFNLPAALYSLGAAINYHWLGIDLLLYGYVTTVDDTDNYLWITVLALVAFNIGYLTFRWNRIRSVFPGLATTPAQEEVLAQWALVGMTASFAIMLIGFEFFDLRAVLSNPYGTISISDAAASTLIHFSALVEASVILAASFLFKTRRWRTPFGIAVLGVLGLYLGFALLIGKRATLLSMGLGLLLAYHFFRKRVTLVVLFVCLFLASSLLVFMQISRSSMERSLPSMVAEFQENTAGFENWQDWAEKLLSQGDFLADIPTIMDLVPAMIDFKYGYTYLEAFYRLTPGFLWRGVFSQGYSQLLGEHRAFFYIAEAYLNFGFAGIVIVPFIFGALLKLFNQWKQQYKGNFLVLVLYATLAGSIAYLPRLDLGSVLKGLVYEAAFLIILYALSSNYAGRASQRDSVTLVGEVKTLPLASQREPD